MKKWMYVLAPTLMLAGFVFVFRAHVEEAKIKERATAARIEKERADAEAKKKAAELKARDDAKKRQDERDAEERKKEADKLAKQAADDKKVRDQTQEYLAKGAAAQKQNDALEAQLGKLRKDKDATSRESFEIAKKVELARIARRNAELEIQRMTEMVSRRAADSSLTRPPVLPPPPPPAKK
ncbi:MAG: hypothetical protein ACO3G4_13965 [Opitutaceae bacterium]